MPNDPNDDAPKLVGDFLKTDGRDDPESMRSVKGHQNGKADAASGGADSSPLEDRSTDERSATPDAEKMGAPDDNLRRK